MNCFVPVSNVCPDIISGYILLVTYNSVVGKKEKTKYSISVINDQHCYTLY